MKKIILSLAVITAFVACKKSSPLEDSPETLEVTQKNMSVVSMTSNPNCLICGSTGFPIFENIRVDYKDDAVFMAWVKDFESQEGTDLHDAITGQVGLSGTPPEFFFNFINDNGDTTLDKHIEEGFVEANSNYEFTASGTTVSLKTTVKFFADLEGEYYLAPYMIVDNIIANQNGSPDGAFTRHRNYVAGIATPLTNSTKQFFGYKISDTKVQNNQTMNIDFTIKRELTWKTSDISFAMIIFKKQPWGYQFVNAFTK